MKIVGTNHTDPQDPAGLLSVIACGDANSARQSLYRRYMAGWFEYHLRGDTSYAPWILNFPGGQLAADLSANRITYRAVLPLRLGLGLSSGGLALEVSGPSGQRFSLEHSQNGGPWVPMATNTTPVVPVVLPLAPPTDLELWRTRSLPTSASTSMPASANASCRPTRRATSWPPRAPTRPSRGPAAIT
jgi:hypothetical protein